MSFSLVDMSKPEKVRVEPSEVRRGDLGHLVPRRDQAVDHAPVRGDLAHGEDVRIGRPHRVVDDDPAARADLQAAGACQLVAGPDARRDDHHVDVEPPAVG